MAACSQRDTLDVSDTEAVRQLSDLVKQAVQMRMLSDVPLGAFLSGGIDSSLVAAVMQAESNKPIRTFSIGSEHAEFDEAKHARAVAKHLGTDHVEAYVSAQDAMDVIPSLAEMFDEPFADSSQIPTHIVSVLARRDVTVALSGDGGDELFGGYNRHLWGDRLWRWAKCLPQIARSQLSHTIQFVRPATWDKILRRLDPVLPQAFRQRMPGYKLHKLAMGMEAASPTELYERLVSQWATPAEIVVRGTERERRREFEMDDKIDFATQMMLMDMQRYLPDDILTKVDRASMAVGLEARVPLLDHRIAEFALRLPLKFKIRKGKSKWLLREVLDQFVPRHLIERPKSGFGIPLGDWLRGPLREWAESLLDPQLMAAEGYLRTEPIQTAWLLHLRGERNAEYLLWTVLMFQDWLRKSHQANFPARLVA